jgi:hypothetical protein
MKTDKLVAILIILVAIIGLSMIITSKEEVKEVPIAPVEDFTHTEMYKDFMVGCVDTDPSMFTQCDCMAKHIHNNLGTEGMLRMSVEYALTEEFSDPMIDAVVSCTL